MFEVGDLISGNNCVCRFTNSDMKVGKVEYVWIHPVTNETHMDVRIISHIKKKEEGNLYPAKNDCKYFNIINRR